MSVTRRLSISKLRWKSLASVVTCCFALGPLAGCTSTLGGVPPAETVHLHGYYAPIPSLDDLIEESLCIVSGRVVDVRYDILYDTFDYRDGETPLPPEAMTVITIEVTHVFMGATEPADKIEVYQMGGVMGQTLFSYDQMPFLADHDGEDLVLFLRTWNYSLAETTPYALADSIGGAWLDESGNLSLLWGVVYDNKEYHPVWVDPADRKVPGAPEFPTVMTVDELKQAIAEHK